MRSAAPVTKSTAIVSSYNLQIICLANSRKMLGRCVAGKIVDANGAFGTWVRPVSDRTEKELSVYDRHYEGSIEPALLDVMNITFLRRDTHDYQPENHLIDPNFYWSRSGQLTYAQARRAVDASQSDLWGLSPDSSYHGQYDRIPLASASSFGYSLKFIAVDDLTIRVRAEGSAFGDMKKKLRGYFTYANINYALTVTDPTIERNFLSRTEGTYSVGSALLCVSLGEPYKGHAYKLIASVILPP
jgi:hypothetical protein